MSKLLPKDKCSSNGGSSLIYKLNALPGNKVRRESRERREKIYRK